MRDLSTAGRGSYANAYSLRHALTHAVWLAHAGPFANRFSITHPAPLAYSVPLAHSVCNAHACRHVHHYSQSGNTVSVRRRFRLARHFRQPNQ
jgi:hypothetical protein